MWICDQGQGIYDPGHNLNNFGGEPMMILYNIIVSDSSKLPNISKYFKSWKNGTKKQLSKLYVPSKL